MNHLTAESSLYLRQHANNPVDWYPWGDEAIARANQLDRPIFLSVGYSACHWCHVMEHESFEDEATAKFLNEHFISIKVDREERPDIDHLYMTALQTMTRECGGWPLSVWLTPDLHPFYAGTYYPPDDRYGAQRPSFKRLLAAIAEAWRERRDEIRTQAANVTENLRLIEAGETEAGELSPKILDDAARTMLRGFDAIHGGFGSAPKFPHALELRFLLRAWKRSGSDELLHVVRHSLEKMAAGGIYDQIGGGFHRYSTDARWLVPHFEKMLYDNALIVSACVDAWRATREPEYRRIAEETLDYVLREMTDVAGPFYSSQDADSEGEEGKFYVWSKAQIDALLDADTANLVHYVFGITQDGNFEGSNIPNRTKTWSQLARLLNLPEAELRMRIDAAKATLYRARSERVWPGRDEKILTSWNGLMITAFAQAGAAFGAERFTRAAMRSAEFIEHHLLFNGILHRTCSVGSPPRIAGYLEDYACFSAALVDLYQATFEPRWIALAVRLVDGMIARFADPAGGFYSTSADHAHLIARGKDRYDGSTPSGNAVAATALVRLGRLTDRRDLTELGAKTLQNFVGSMTASPGGSAQMLTALDGYLGSSLEIVVIGAAASEETQRVLNGLRSAFLPSVLLLFHDPANGPTPEDLLPLLKGKTAGQQVTTFICERQTCGLPLEGAAAVEEWLDAHHLR